MAKRWKLTMYRTPATEECVDCQAPGCTRLATWWCTKTATGLPPVRTARCNDHARIIANRSKLTIEGLT